MEAEVGSDTSSPARASWRAVALPAEHGGWSITAEPVVLGLFVAWSWPGFMLGLAAMVAFVSRTPLRVVLVDRWRHRSLERTRLATRVLAVEWTLLTVFAVVALATGEPGLWLPLIVAAPLVLLELWFDMRSRSRRLVPELAGSVGIASVAAAIALAGGEPERLAWGLWAVLAIRSVSAIPYVRTQVQRAKTQPIVPGISVSAQVIAILAAAGAWSADLIPAASGITLSVFAAANVVDLRLPARRAVVIGVQQTVVGAIVIGATAIAIRIA